MFFLFLACASHLNSASVIFSFESLILLHMEGVQGDLPFHAWYISMGFYFTTHVQSVPYHQLLPLVHHH
jgi:hypothetical protein